MAILEKVQMGASHNYSLLAKDYMQCACVLQRHGGGLLGLFTCK